MAVSSRFRQVVNSVEGEQPLILLEISHVGLVSPVRIVNDTVSIISKGNTYIPCPFNVALPSDLEQGFPEARISIDNVGQELTQWLEISKGGEGAKCKLIQVLRDFPDDWEVEYNLDLTNLSVNITTVSGTLGYRNVFDIPAIGLQYRREVLPELF